MSFSQFFFKRIVPCSIAYIGASTVGSFIHTAIFDDTMNTLIEEDDRKVDARFSMLYERCDDLKTGQSHILTAVGKL